MFTSPKPVSSPVWVRVCLTLLAGPLLISQLQCGGGGSDSAPTGQSPGGTETAGGQNAIASENALPGSSAWRIGNPAMNGQLAAYADRESYPGGSDVHISVSADPAGQFSWKVFRMGGYQGLGGRLYAEGGPVSAPRQADPSFDSTTGLVVAGWPATFTISTRHADGTPWLTGVYLVLLTKAADGSQTYSIFILRDDTRDAEVALHFPTATWQAYNDFGGESLYVSSHGLGHARKVSLDRPITLGFGSGKFLYEESEMARWIEDLGYDVEYFSSVDIGGAVNRIGKHKLYITSGHDEYATMAVMDRLQAALGAGTSLAFLTGNTFAWQIRYEQNERVMVGYKEFALTEDPIRLTADSRLTTALFRDPLVNRPESALLGVMSDGSNNEPPGADWVVTNANHWIYANTGLTSGSHIPNLVFYEWDGPVTNFPTPSGLTELARSVVPNNVRPGSEHQATMYERGNAFVFAAGTIYFNQHLSTEPTVARMMQNLLTRAGARQYTAE